MAVQLMIHAEKATDSVASTQDRGPILTLLPTPREPAAKGVAPTAGTESRPRAIDSERASRVLDLLAKARLAVNPREKRRLLDAVIVEHMRVAHSVAARYRGKGVDREDLDQVAYLGLVKAAENCDPDKCEDFLHYAVPTINGELKRYFRDHAWAVRPPRRLQEMQPAVAGARRDLLQHLGREPINSEIAAALEVDESEVREAVVAGRGFSGVCLDPMVENGFAGADEDPALSQVEDHMMLAGMFAHLDDREREILALRYFKGLTQAEIGRELGVSQMHISRILRRAIKKLQEPGSAKAIA
ncbi:sigma-70 family RNA polymerase sigma factor [Nakamurella antarctica]|nr:sigma-70 family RNA polymerase sigma factor [Nakamurella antarctica]